MSDLFSVRLTGADTAREVRIVNGGKREKEGVGHGLGRWATFNQIDPRLSTYDSMRWADGLARNTARKAAALRGETVSDAEHNAVVRIRSLSHDTRFRMANRCLAAMEMGRHPDPYRAALQMADRICDSHANGRAFDAADPANGGSLFPGLIAQGVVEEMVPLPMGNFDLLFPPISAKNPILPGSTDYSIWRGTPAGQAQVFSGSDVEGIGRVSVGMAAEKRATCWLAIADDEDLISSYQANLPGSGIVGMDERGVLGDAMMIAGANKIQWFGSPGSNMTGLLDDPALVKLTVDGITLSSNGPDIIDAIVARLGQIVNGARGLWKPDTIIISQAMILQLCRVFQNGTALTESTIISILREKVLAQGMPTIKRFEIAWELDYLGDGGETVASPSNFHGMLITTSGKYGIQRVPILPLTTLPVVDQGLLKLQYKVMQIGRPYVSGLAQHTLLRFPIA